MKGKICLVPFTDDSYVCQLQSWMVTTPSRSAGITVAVTDETMRNLLKLAIVRTESDGGIFLVPVTPNPFHHIYIMHMLYHR